MGCCSDDADGAVGKADKYKKGGDVGRSTVPCPGEFTNVFSPRESSPPKPKIVAVAFLDGNDTTELGAGGKQFVNLPRDEKWVDGVHVLNIDRLGEKPRVKVSFDQAGTHDFKLKYEAGGANTAYSDAEEGRNPKFTYQKGEKSYVTDAEGSKIIADDFFVNVAGKNKFTLVATDDDGNEVRSQSIEVHRLFYYQEVKMKSATPPANLQALRDEFARHNITLVALPPSVDIEDKENVAQDGTDALRFEVAEYCTKEKEPYVVVIAYAQLLCTKLPSLVLTKSNVRVGPGAPDVVLPLVDTNLAPRDFWPGTWLESAVFEAADGPVPIAAENCVPHHGSLGAAPEVSVKVADLAPSTTWGTITLKVNCIEKQRAGVSFEVPEGNLIAVATKKRRSGMTMTCSDDNQVQTLIHEMGHKIGMVPDGSARLPDKPPYHYTDGGHQGPHCHANVAPPPPYSGKRGSSCVMFGESNNIEQFCVHCAVAVRKMDISNGWPGIRAPIPVTGGEDEPDIR